MDNVHDVLQPFINFLLGEGREVGKKRLKEMLVLVVCLPKLVLDQD